MNVKQCQQALERGQKLEGNGIRAYVLGKTFVAQSLEEGWWVERPTRKPRLTKMQTNPARVVGKLPSLTQHAGIQAALGGRLDGIGCDREVSTGLLAVALTLGGRGHEGATTTEQIPTVEKLRALARARWGHWRPCPPDADVQQMAAATAALLRLGGHADEEALLDALGLGSALGREALWLGQRLGDIVVLERGKVPAYAFARPLPAYDPNPSRGINQAARDRMHALFAADEVEA